MQSPDFIWLLGAMQAWGARRVGTLPWILFNQESAVNLMIFWVHNLRPSLGGMRPTRHGKSPTNGTPNSLQVAVIKDFRLGLQIRPRRFDSGFGLHIRKPRRFTSAGFFYACDLADHFRNFSDRLRNLGNDLNPAACGQLDEISVVIVWDASC